MILDLIVIALLVIFIIIGCHRGAARAMLGILFSFVSYLAAVWLSDPLAVRAYDMFVRPALRGAVNDSVEKAAAGTVTSISDALPEWIKSALNLSGADIDSSAVLISGNLSERAVSAVDNAVRPIIVGILSILLTLLLFWLFSFILKKLLMKTILSAFELPAINRVNRFFGGFIGLFEGILFVWMLAYLLRLLLPYIDGETAFLNESTIYNSFIFYHFYSGNIFTMLTSWIS